MTKHTDDITNNLSLYYTTKHNRPTSIAHIASAQSQHPLGAGDENKAPTGLPPGGYIHILSL